MLMRSLRRGEAQRAAQRLTSTAARALSNTPRDIGWLLDRNQAWRKLQNPLLFEAAARGQSPQYLWIGCADSRVPAETLMGLDMGMLFVHRNIANQALGNDMNCMSVLQYAVDVLKVPHIIVCGHYDCGGVKAALMKTQMPSPLDNWLRNIRDVHRMHKQELSAIATMDDRVNRLVELNAIEQCVNIFKTGVVQRRRWATFHGDEPYTQPRIHAMVYNPADGALTKLPVDFKEVLDEIRDVYEFELAPLLPQDLGTCEELTKE